MTQSFPHLATPVWLLLLPAMALLGPIDLWPLFIIAICACVAQRCASAMMRSISSSPCAVLRKQVCPSQTYTPRRIIL